MTLSIRANIPEALQDHLIAEKAKAEDARSDIATGYNGIQFQMKPHGGHGYAHILTEGPHGAMWSLNPTPKDPWGVRVSIGSECLALFGLGGARAKMERTAQALELAF